ncbi:MAG: TlpA family protein disulfide reductase [Planctomycetia bacterium]|nr:TlpA family protein disulfide reductase [Planctomycetia bacterium]
MSASRYLLVAVMASALAGCGDPAPEHPALGRVIGELPLVSLADRGRPAPAFTGKVTLLTMWGTWCPPCRRELPGLVRLAGRLADEPRFQLVAVSCGGGGPDDLDELAAATKQFLDSQRLSLDAWGDPAGTTRAILAASYGFAAFPTTYLVGPDAAVRAVWVGFRSRDEADRARAVVEALKAPPAAAPRAAR